jgi:NitT/TauT family transport system permease protein
LKSAALYATTFLIAMGAWELLYRVGLLNPLIFASPSLVVLSAVRQRSEFVAAFEITVFEINTAVAISWVAGVALGAVLGSVRLVGRIFLPFVSALIAIPFVILYPVLMAWFGIGAPSKIIFGVLLGLFPVTLNTAIGVQAIEPGYLRMARAMGASPLQVLFRVVVPLAMPAVIAGLRIGTSLVVVGVILTEMLASTGGIGYVIATSQSMFQTGSVMFGVILGLLIAAIANWILSVMESRFCRWRLEQQRNAG